mgnify:CR=1 FL=1
MLKHLLLAGVALTLVAGTAPASAKDLKAGYVNNPRAVRSLEALTGDSAYKSLSDEKKSELLGQFEEPPFSQHGLGDYREIDVVDRAGIPAGLPAELIDGHEIGDLFPQQLHDRLNIHRLISDYVAEYTSQGRKCRKTHQADFRSICHQ